MNNSDSSFYNIVASNCAKRFNKETNKIFFSPETATQSVQWLISQKKYWSAASWRVYKSAIISVFGNEQNEQIQAAIATIKKEFSNSGQVKCLTKAQRKIRRQKGKTYSKQISGEDRKLLAKELTSLATNEFNRDEKRKIAELARLWIDAGIITGLRPSEWLYSRLAGPFNEQFPAGPEQLYRLVVRNGKYIEDAEDYITDWLSYCENEMRSIKKDVERNKKLYLQKLGVSFNEVPKSFGEQEEINARSNGEFRVISLQDLSEEGKWIIRKFHDLFMDYIKISNVSLVNLLKRVNRVIDSASISCGLRQKNITLYSTRHQFVSNQKLANCHPFEIAALMGHYSVKSAWENYGKKKYGDKYYNKFGKTQADTGATKKIANRKSNQLLLKKRNKIT